MDGKLKKIMANVFNIEEASISDASSNQNIREWDSLKHIDLILSIEEEFKINRLDINEIVQMTSLSNIKRVLLDRGISE